MTFLRLKVMLIIGGIGFLAFLGLLAFVSVIISDETGDFDSSIDMDSPDDWQNVSLSEDVLAHQSKVEKYASEYGISDYVPILLAIIAVEIGSHSKGGMQIR